MVKLHEMNEAPGLPSHAIGIQLTVTAPLIHVAVTSARSSLDQFHPVGYNLHYIVGSCWLRSYHYIPLPL